MATNFGPDTATVGAGGTLLKTGGGCLIAPFVISQVGSGDCVIELFDGLNASGNLIATHGMSSIGPRSAPNYAFATGLFVQVTGTSPGTAQISWC